MLQVRGGAVDKLGLLYDRYYSLVFSYFYNIFRDQALSKDLAQTVFMRILKYRERYREDGVFKHWMFRIARNIGRDQFQKQGRWRMEDAENWKDKLTASGSVQDDLIKREQLQQLHRALNELDSEKREVLVLSKLEGMRYKEIAAILDCTEGAVKVKVYRALKALKQVFISLENQ